MDVPTRAAAATGNTWFDVPAGPLPESDAERERALLAAVAAACACLAEAAEPQASMQAACDALVRCTGLDRAYVFELTADGRQCLLVAEASRPGVGSIDALWGSRVFEVADYAEVWRPLLAGQVYESVQAGRQGANADFNGALGSLSDLMVPVMVAGRCWGCLGFDNTHEPRRYTLTEAQVLGTVAHALAGVVQRHAAAQALADERERRIAAERERADDNARLARLLSHVVQSSRALIDADSHEFEARLQQWLGEVGREARAQRATFYDVVPFEHTGQPTARMLCEWVAEGVKGSLPVSFATPIVIDPRGGEAEMQQLLSGAVVVFHAEGMAGPMRDFLDEQGNATVVAVPVFIENRQWGCISFDYAQRQTLADSIVAVLQTAADTLAAVLRRNDIAAALGREREARLAAERQRADQAAAYAERIERQARLLSAVAQSAEELLATRDLQTTLGVVLERVGLLSSADHACLAFLQWTPDDGALWGWHETAHAWTRPGAVPRVAGMPSRFAMQRDDPSWARVLRAVQAEGRCLQRVEDFGEPYRSALQSLGVRWSLRYPLMAEDGIVGLVGFDFATPFSQYDEAELSALRTLASTMSDALARQSLERRTLMAEQQRSAALARVGESLRRTAQQVAAGVSLERMLGAALLEVTAISGARSAGVHRVARPEQQLQFLAFVSQGERLDLAADPRLRTWREPVALGQVAHWLARLQMSELWTQDLRDSDAQVFGDADGEVHRAFGHSHVVHMPLFAGDELVGVMALCFGDAESLQRMDEAHARAVGHLVATALQMAQLSDAARKALLAGERERLQRERAAELARANEVLRGALAALPDDAEGEAFLARALAEVVAQAGATVGHLSRSDDEAGLLRLVGSSRQGRWSPQGEPDDPLHFRTGWPLVPAVMSALLEQRRLQWLHIAEGKPHDFMLPATHAWHLRQGHQAAAFQVLAVGPRAVGLIGLSFLHATPPAEVQLELVHALGQPMALALELSRLARLARRGAEQAAVLGERNRLAREIHDGIAQSFLAIGMQLDAAEAMPGAADAAQAAAWRQARELARHGLGEARRAVAALRPYELHKRSLPGALRELLVKRLADSGLNLALELPAHWQPLPPEVEDHLFRITQEAVNNVLRHAAAQALRVELSQAGGETSVLVADDGVGFEPAAASSAAGFGLEGMQQRAGRIGARIDLHSRPGQGTQILVSWTGPEPDAKAGDER